MKPALLLLAATIVPLMASRAAAEGDPDMQGPPVHAPERSGWTASLNIGPAEFHVIPDDGDNQRTEGPGISIRLGKYLSQTAAVLLFVDRVDPGTAHSDLYGGAVQFNIDDRWYARVGGGFGRVSPGGGETEGGGMTYNGAGAVVAVGREFLQLRDLAITGEAAITGIRILEDGVDATVLNAAVHVGVVWF